MAGPGHRPSLPTVLRIASSSVVVVVVLRRRRPPPQQLGSLLTLPQVGDHGIVEAWNPKRMFAFDQVLREGLSSFDPIV